MPFKKRTSQLKFDVIKSASAFKDLNYQLAYINKGTPVFLA